MEFLKMDPNSKEFQENLPELQRSEPDKDGIITEISYYINSDGKTVRVTTKKKRITKEVKIKRAIEERKKWKKFGAAAKGDNSETTSLGEEVFIEKPGVINNTATLNIIPEKVVLKRKWRSLAKKEETEASPKEKSNKYVPRHLRKNNNTTEINPETITNIKVSNLANDVTDDMLKNIFQNVCDVKKVYIPKDKYTGESRGFGFVHFYRRKDAEYAKEKMEGYALNHLIIKIDWALPRKEDKYVSNRKKSEGYKPRFRRY